GRRGAAKGVNGESSRPGAGMTPVSGSLEQVDRGEEGDPDDVDEVPVVRRDDGADGLGMRVALGGERAAENEQESDESAGHVQTVETSGQVEDRPITVRGEGDVLAGQLGILEDCAR